MGDRRLAASQCAIERNKADTRKRGRWPGELDFSLELGLSQAAHVFRLLEPRSERCAGPPARHALMSMIMATY